MDLPSFLIGLFPVVAIGVVGVLACRRRHGRRSTFSLIVNPYTLAVEPDVDAHGRLPAVNPAPADTYALTTDPSTGPSTDELRARSLTSAAPARPAEKA